MRWSTSNSRRLNGSRSGWAGGGRDDVSSRLCFGQEVSHRGTFIDKDTDEAARLCQRQRVPQQLHSLVLFAMCLESDRLENHHLEPLILPTLCLHLTAP